MRSDHKMYAIIAIAVAALLIAVTVSVTIFYNHNANAVRTCVEHTTASVTDCHKAVWGS